MPIKQRGEGDAGERQLLQWRDQIKASKPRVALADGDDPRVLRAAARLAQIGVVPVVVADPASVQQTAGELGLTLGPLIEVMGPGELKESPAGDLLAERCAAVGAEKSQAWLNDPLFLAVASIPGGLAEACVAGCARPTADVLRAALRILGTAPGSSCVNSSFFLLLPGGRPMSYGDCAVIPEPTAEQLCQIAIDTCQTFELLAGTDSIVAMLSFSTKGSAEHASVQLVRDATQLVHDREPEIVIDGELQFDAALVESVARSKAPGSVAAGHANVFIFPNLAAGNIGYKITERLAGARAYGPILQGLAAPVSDLSRGCSSSDIVNVAVISLLQAQSLST